MKAYQEHLKSTASFGETVSPTRKPIFRSSAIFPVIETQEFSTRILFMGYWLKKRNIPEVSILVTLRNQWGSILLRKTIIVDRVKAFAIPVSSMLSELRYEPETLIGSIELEVHATRDMVFPYPAFVVNYFSELGSTSVHTTGRVYNDIEDMTGNSKYQVPESGFDIYPGQDNMPFFCFVNGPLDNSNKPIAFEIIDEGQSVTKGEICLGKILPYQSCFVMLKDHIDVDGILKSKGTIKLRLDFEGFFTRVIAGNFVRNKAVSITHSFYDSSSVFDDHAYLDNREPSLHDSYIFIPLYLNGDFFTDLVYYPIYSPSNYSIDLYFFDVSGNRIGSIDGWKHFSTKDSLFFTIRLKQLIANTFDSKASAIIRGMLISNNWGNKKIPTRLKYGLNIGLENREFRLPTNICFAPEISNPKLMNKPSTFKWAPVLNSHESEIVITNCGPQKDYKTPANIKIEYFRESDDQTISEEDWLLPYAQHVINVNKMGDLKKFFENGSGWVTISSDNPFVNAWYFDFNHETGLVAGDHSF